MEDHLMLIHSELSTPIDRADIEPATGLEGYTGIKYHVWERTDVMQPTLFGVKRPVREYRGLIAAADLVWLLFPRA